MPLECLFLSFYLLHHCDSRVCFPHVCSINMQVTCARFRSHCHVVSWGFSYCSVVLNCRGICLDKAASCKNVSCLYIRGYDLCRWIKKHSYKSLCKQIPCVYSALNYVSSDLPAVDVQHKSLFQCSNYFNLCLILIHEINDNWMQQGKCGIYSRSLFFL